MQQSSSGNSRALPSSAPAASASSATSPSLWETAASKNSFLNSRSGPLRTIQSSQTPQSGQPNALTASNPSAIKSNPISNPRSASFPPTARPPLLASEVSLPGQLRIPRS